MVQTLEELVCLAVWEGQGHRDLWPDLIDEVSLWYEWLNCSQDSASITNFCLLENSRVISMTYFSKEIKSWILWIIYLMKNRKNSTENFVWVIDLNNKTWGFWGVLIWHIKVKNSYENSFGVLMTCTWFGKLEMVTTADLLLQEHGWPGTEQATFMHDRNPVAHCVCLVQEVSGQKNGAPCHNHRWKVNDHQTTQQAESFLIHVYPFPQKKLSLVSKTNVFLF